MVLLPAQSEKTSIEPDSSLYSAVVAIAAVALFSTVGGKNVYFSTVYCIYVYIYEGISLYIRAHLYIFIFIFICI
jgi:hypothetical protein